MGKLTETVSALLSKIAELLGIKPPEQRRTELMVQKLTVAKASNVDRLEALKEKIRQMEAQALRKKKEYEKTEGAGRRIVSAEIERLFRDLDRMHGQENIIAANLDRISVAQAKIEEYNSAQATGVNEDDLDDIAVDLQEALDALRVGDRAARELERVEYESPETASVGEPGRLEEEPLEGATATALSAETEERLKQLETEQD